MSSTYFSKLVVAALVWHVSSVPAADPLDPEKISRGMSAQVYTDAQGEEHDYVLFVPYAWNPPEQLPVLLFLNGTGENGADGVLQVSQNFGPQLWEMQEFFPFLAIAPQCRLNSTWTGNTDDAHWAMEILKNVTDAFKADEDRIYLTGVSSGGSGVWEIASENAGLFAAIAPLCGNGGDLERIANAQLPVWNFLNDGDDEGLVERSRRARERLIRLGHSPLFTEFHNKGHDCWNATYRMPALYAWLLEQRLSQNASASAFEYLTPGELLTKWTVVDGEWSTSDGDVLTINGRGRSLIVSDRAARTQELHMDLWMKEGASSKLALIPARDVDTPKSLMTLEISIPKTGGIIRSMTGEWLSALNLAAQSSLKTGSWNDVRLRIDSDGVHVKVNGWNAADVPIAELLEQDSMTESDGPIPAISPQSGEVPGRFRFAISGSPGTGEVRWRYIRVRMLP